MRTSDVSKSTERVYQPLVACSHMLCNIYVLESNITVMITFKLHLEIDRKL